MMLPPAILDLEVAPPDRRRVRVWLPLFLLWPLALVLVVLALVCTVLTDFVLIVIGQRYHHYTVLLVRSLGVMCETRGMVVRINNGTTTVNMTVR
ncbi:MAG: hypothetical protein HGB10_09925 [Coriobacteriia bacterium]|nr:hypothetical protein [Coriobacteriia bacterium]